MLENVQAHTSLSYTTGVNKSVTNLECNVAVCFKEFTDAQNHCSSKSTLKTVELGSN